MACGRCRRSTTLKWTAKFREPLLIVHLPRSEGSVLIKETESNIARIFQEDSPEFNPRGAIEEEADEEHLPADLPAELLAELGTHAAMAATPTRIRQRPSDQSLRSPPAQAPVQLQQTPNRTYRPRAYASVANGELPSSSCRIRITEEGTRRYKFKISDPVSTGASASPGLDDPHC